MVILLLQFQSSFNQYLSVCNVIHAKNILHIGQYIDILIFLPPDIGIGTGSKNQVRFGL